MVLKHFDLLCAVFAGTLFLWLPLGAVAAPSAAPIDLVLVVEDSDAVRAADAARRLPSATTSLLEQLPPEARVALISFDDVAMPIIPLTRLDATVRERVTQALEALDLTAIRTNNAAGLERAIYELTREIDTRTRRIIVLQHTAPIDVGDATKDATFRRWAIEVLANKAMTAGIEIHSLAFGPYADVNLGAALAERTGGSAHAPVTAGELGDALAALLYRIGSTEETSLAVAPPASAPAAEEPRTAGDTTPDTPPATQTEPAVPAAESTPAPIAGAVVELTDEVAALENLPDPAAGVTTTLTATDLKKGLDKTDNSEALLNWPAADHPVWRGLIYALVALVLAAVTVSFLRYRRRSSNAVVDESGSGPRLVDVKRITGRSSYPLDNKMARISRTPGANTANVVTVHIPHDVISRAHAFIDLRDGAYWVTDPGSNNGTFVNDQRVDGSQMLHHGDRIRFASFDFIFENASRADTSAAAGSSPKQPEANDGDRTVLVGQGETEFVPARSDAEPAKGAAPQSVTQGNTDGAAAKPDSTVVRPAR